MSFNDKLSYTEHSVVSPTSDFTIGFEDYALTTKDRINVTVDDVDATEAGYTVKRKNALVVTLTPPVNSGTVRLQRETNIDTPFHRFTAGAKFVASNVDQNYTQILHSQQEVRNLFGFTQDYIRRTLANFDIRIQGVESTVLDLRRDYNDLDKRVTVEVAERKQVDRELKDYIDSTVNGIVGEPFLPILDKFVMTESGDTQRQANSKYTSSIADRSTNLMKRSVFIEIPFIFPDYEAAYAAVGGNSNGYLYPQGFAHDDADNTYINYAASSSTSVIVKYDKAANYKGYIILNSGSPEDIIVKYDGAVLKLYTKTTGHILAWVDITSIAWTGSRLSLTTVPTVRNVHLQMDYDNGMWIIEQRGAVLGKHSTPRTKFNLYNERFEYIGDFYTRRSVVGFQTTSNEYYPFVPKTQGIALMNNHVFFGLGGSYIPSIDGAISPASSAIGLAELSLDGSVLNYGTINATKYLDVAKTKYSYAIRTEAEGLAKLSDGTLTQLIILGNRNVTQLNKKSGIIIEKLLVADGDDYSEHQEAYTPVDLKNFEGVFPRNADGLIYNPLTRTSITTLDQLIEFMSSVDINQTSYYTSAVALEYPSGMTVPSGSLVSIQNSNNIMFFISIKTVSNYSVDYAYNGTGLYRINPTGSVLKLNDRTSGGFNAGRIVGANLNDNDSEISLLQFTSTQENNLLVLGGGSASYGACNRVQVHVTDDLTSKAGTIIHQTSAIGFIPYGGDLYVNGNAGNRWASTHSAKYMFNATVGQFYGRGSPEGVVTAGIGSTYQRMDGGAGSSFYVKESGTESSGWVAK